MQFLRKMWFILRKFGLRSRDTMHLKIIIYQKFSCEIVSWLYLQFSQLKPCFSAWYIRPNFMFLTICVRKIIYSYLNITSLGAYSVGV
jgi:hypothetical protein